MTNPNWMNEAQACADGLFGLWRSIDPEFKSKYALDIWRMFENHIRVAANQTSSLVRLVDRLCAVLQTNYGKNDALRQQTLAWVESGQDYVMLSALRQHTAYIVMLIREEMKQIKENYEDAQAN